MKKKIILTLVAIVCVVLVAAVVLLANLGSVVESTARTFLPKLTESDVQVANVDVRPFSGSASVEGFVIGNPAGYNTESAIQFNNFDISMDTASLKTDVIHIKEITIKDPKITYEVGLGNSNVGTLIKNIEKNLAKVVKAKEESGEKAAAGKKVVIDVVRIEGASVVLSAKLTKGIGAPIPLPLIEIKDLGKETNGIEAFKAFAVILRELSTAVFDAVGDVGGAIVEGATEAAGKAVKDATDAAGKAMEKTVGTAGKAVEGAGKVISEDAGKAAGKAVEGAGKAAGSVVKGTGEVAGKAVEGTGKMAGKAVEGTGKAAGKVVEGAGKAAGSVVEGTGKAVGGALKGLLGGGKSNEKQDEADTEDK